MNQSNFCISVIIPTHNGANRLKNCLDALSKSVSKDDEIIVVNDASTDHTEQIVNQFNCRLFTLSENIGAARARNYGATQAKNKILFFTDDDVLVKSDTLHKLRVQFRDPKISGVLGVLDSDIPFKNFASNLKNLWMRFSYLKCPTENVGLFYTSVASIRKEVFEKVGGFDVRYTGASLLEDTEFGQRVWQQGYNIRIDPLLGVTHVKHYTLMSMLKTDFDRAKALTHMKLRKSGEKFFTSVPFSFQLAIPFLLLSVLLLVSALTWNMSFWWSGLCGGFFFFLVSPWINFLFKTKGIVFGFAGTLFQPIDSLIVGLGMITACLRHFVGKTF